MPDESVSHQGQTNWLGRLDARVTRLEERSIHQNDDLVRLEKAVERLSDALVAHIKTIEAKIDAGQRWVIAFLATSLVTLVMFGAKIIFDFITRP